MKKILTKRVSLICPWTHEEIILSDEFNPEIDDYSILCCLYSPLLHEWIEDELWVKVPYKNTNVNRLIYRFEVWEHIEYKEQWFDRLKKRIAKRLITM